MAQDVAAILTRPCFAPAEVLCACREDRQVLQTRPTAEKIAAYLSHPANEAILLRTPGKASIEIASGNDRKGKLRPTSLYAYVVVPFVPSHHETLLKGICDLAVALRAAAGFVAADQSHSLALMTTLLGPPGARHVFGAGIELGEQRRLERVGRWLHAARVGTELAGVEWGTLLGPGHLRKIDLEALRSSGSFATVKHLAQGLAYVQVTNEPMDDITGQLEEKLPAARRALTPLLMDLSEMSQSRPGQE